MLKPFLSAALLLGPGLAHAQDRALPPVRYPAIVAGAADAKGFVPKGWALEQQQTGDLDGDGLADLALALHQTDARNILPNTGGMCGDKIDTNPRILVIALARPGGGYRLAMQNHSFVPRHDNPCADDPFDANNEGGGGIAIKRGTLHIRLTLFMSAGGWDMGSREFTFRWQQGALRLIGFDYLNVQRNSGEMQTLGINYLTRKVRIAHGKTDSDVDKVRWSTVPARVLLTLEQLGNGTEFSAGGMVDRL